LTKGKNYRVVAYMRCKNEADILDNWLQRTSEIADAIVVLDDASQDDTYKILKSHPKVVKLFQNLDQGGRWYQVRDLNRLLGETKKMNPEWIYFSDADELADGRLPDMLDDLLSQQDVGQYLFREITLWRSNTHYRIDHPEYFMRIHPENISLIRNVPSLRWISRPTYLRQAYKALRSWVRGRRYIFLKHRGGITRSFVGVQGEVVHLDDVFKLHYHFVNWENAWIRQIRTTLNHTLSRSFTLYDIDHLVHYATQRMDETGLKLAPVKSEWKVL